MKKLSKNNLILISLTLFSMFFGAGNLIFPPFLGAQAGTNTWIAMLGFCVSAIALPIFGVIAVAKSGGLRNLASRVHPIFAAVFTFLIYLSIGPLLAIPRTASTSFEMAVVPFMSGNNNLSLMQVAYSVIFFCIALSLALNPDKLIDRLGKILTPCLLTLILIVVIGCLISPVGKYGVPLNDYAAQPLIKGFLDGYLTMDTIAALNFGIIISINIRAKGIQEEKSIVKETIKAGLIAGFVLLIVYISLAHVGALSGGTFTNSTNGAQSLTNIVSALYGKSGIIILAIIFAIACLNTCVGLISCCSEYFYTIVPSISYKKWACFFAFISMIISNAGLNKILEVSVPILNAIYPIAIVIILLSFIHKLIRNYRFIYPITVLMTGTVSITYALFQSNISIPTLTSLASKIPFYSVGLGWIIPAVIGMVVGIIMSISSNKNIV
ncbi:branched-chain amino acid transport system II carrier protein [Clostridium vincentii]|uniref:Branched-chain amino acid transport system carrier protein n=1 Tax=Clostridium vincentii TaxID=52704 RepID=A0A2T0B7C5_9CLOT|nr:branched-chain amino acid transport system II carrier protein [Clostridium vincentii]PRR79713.1 Branched-chain amino acid transport system 2 carrier protein [Clostridium vincentii]